MQLRSVLTPIEMRRRAEQIRFRLEAHLEATCLHCKGDGQQHPDPLYCPVHGHLYWDDEEEARVFDRAM